MALLSIVMKIFSEQCHLITLSCSVICEWKEWRAERCCGRGGREASPHAGGEGGEDLYSKRYHSHLHRLYLSLHKLQLYGQPAVLHQQVSTQALKGSCSSSTATMDTLQTSICGSCSSPHTTSLWPTCCPPSTSTQILTAQIPTVLHPLTRGLVLMAKSEIS